MKRRDRSINVFNMSMLDVISGALGAFLIIMIVLMPYYRKEHIDYRAEIESLRAALAETESLAEALADATARAEAAERRAEAAEARASRAEASAAEARSRAAAAEARAAEAARKADNALKVDLVFALDVTSSMADELDELRGSVRMITAALKSSAGSLRIGFIAYRDEGDAFVTRRFALTDMSEGGIDRLQTFVDGLAAAGGGDAPEAVDQAVIEAIGLSWRGDARGILLVIGDAAAHPGDVERTFEAARRFRASGEDRRVSTLYVGSSTSSHADFFRRLAEAGGGDYQAVGGS
ncbi:MAG: VWA domain-containing protein [Gemmatimonadetes bacterium]|nr:MAG: VWA domain-containing protein [Gemmatimonadota bacterium]